MRFNSLQKNDVIVSLASPPGVGAISLIRISGPSLSLLFKKLTKKQPKDRYSAFSKIFHPNSGNVLDESLITFFKSPRSFTGEDVIEISCHGGRVVPTSIIGATIECGARQSVPGEFSYRAFLNGKIDLMEAEAIDLLISTKSDLSANIALKHMGGNIQSYLIKIKDSSIRLLSIIEHELNFSENEIDHTPISRVILAAKKIRKKLLFISKSTLFAKDLASGIRVPLIGKPNSGKSSLFNAMLGKNRAITSQEPGTTRDSIESNFSINGIDLCLIDTAGIWETQNSLDKIGVDRSIEIINNATMCILVDENNPKNLIKSNLLPKKLSKPIFVKSKIDLSEPLNVEGIINTSSKKQIGINKLLTCLSTSVNKYVENIHSFNQPLINQRQLISLESGIESISFLIDSLDEGASLDVAASLLRGFVETIKELIGEISETSIIDNIFNNFCVGK